MLRSLAALLLAAPSSALYYAYDYNGTAPLTADTGTFVAAPRFSVLYGLQTDFNVTAELYVYAGDVCEGLADDTPTKEIALKALFNGKIVVLELGTLDISLCTFNAGGTFEAAFKPIERAGAAGILVLVSDTREPGYQWYRRYQWSDTLDLTIPIVVTSRRGSGAEFRIIVLGGGSTTVTIASGEENVYVTWARSGFCIFFTFVGVVACYALLILYCIALIVLFLRSRKLRNCGCAGRDALWQPGMQVYTLELIGTIIQLGFYLAYGPTFQSERSRYVLHQVGSTVGLIPKSITTMLTAIMWWEFNRTIKKSAQFMGLMRFGLCTLVVVLGAGESALRALPIPTSVNYFSSIIVLFFTVIVPGLYMVIGAIRVIQKMKRATANQQGGDKYFKRMATQFSRWILASGALMLLFLIWICWRLKPPPQFLTEIHFSCSPTLARIRGHSDLWTQSLTIPSCPSLPSTRSELTIVSRGTPK